MLHKPMLIGVRGFVARNGVFFSRVREVEGVHLSRNCEASLPFWSTICSFNPLFHFGIFFVRPKVAGETVWHVSGQNSPEVEGASVYSDSPPNPSGNLRRG